VRGDAQSERTTKFNKARAWPTAVRTFPHTDPLERMIVNGCSWTDRVRGSWILGMVGAAVVVATLVRAAAPSKASSAQARHGTAATSVTVAFSSKMQTLNPDIAVDFPGTNTLHLIGGNLFELYKNQTVPGLAASAKVSKNGLVWTFVLRSGLKFSNGTPLTSADVKASFDRARHDKANSYGSVFLPMVRIDAPNPRTVMITVNRRYASLTTLLGAPEMAIFPAKLINTKNFWNHPISAGPYVLTSWGGTNTVVLTRNGEYWGAKPKVQKITFVTVPDANSALAQVQSGQLDVAFGLPPSLLSQVRAPAKSVVTAMYGSEVMTMRGAAAPFNQQALRVAISDALDRNQMSKVIYGGRLKALKGYWPSTMPGHDASISTAPDLDAARSLIKKSSCASGCTVTLKYCSAAYPEQGPEALIIQSDLGKIGIKVKLIDMDPSSYFNVFAQYNFQLLLYPLFDFQNVPDGIMGFSLLRDGGQQAAYTGLRVPDIEAAVHQIDVSNGSARLAAERKLNRLFVKHAPFATLTEEALIWATRLPTSEFTVSSTTFVDAAR
jgi:peptide/nickel transport system substrate-binding protein